MEGNRENMGEAGREGWEVSRAGQKLGVHTERRSSCQSAAVTCNFGCHVLISVMALATPPDNRGV